MKRVLIRFALLALIPVFAAGAVAAADQPTVDSRVVASLAPLPCEASTSQAETLDLSELVPAEELPLTPAEPGDRAVTCGSWLYNGCCVSQTKYRRRCQFNAAEWWYEYKCQGVCVM